MSDLAPISEFRGEYYFLSNFYAAACMLDGETYPTVEHAFAAAKTLDPAQRAKIKAAASPGDAKRLGRKVKLREGWDDMRLEVAKALIESKFSNPSLMDKLVETGRRELIEGNSWGDSYWGMSGGKGENHLGQILMRLRAKEIARREELRKGRSI